MRALPSGRWMLVLLGLLCVVSVSLGEENVFEDGSISGGEDLSNGETEATATPTKGETGDGEGEDETDDGEFDVKDLLPGLEDVDSDNFIKNYIMGQPKYYRQDYDPVSAKRNETK